MTQRTPNRKGSPQVDILQPSFLEITGCSKRVETVLGLLLALALLGRHHAESGNVSVLLRRSAASLLGHLVPAAIAAVLAVASGRNILVEHAAVGELLAADKLISE